MDHRDLSRYVKIIQNLDKAKSMTVFSFSVMLKLCSINLKKIFSFVVTV